MEPLEAIWFLRASLKSAAQCLEIKEFQQEALVFSNPPMFSEANRCSRALLGLLSTEPFTNFVYKFIIIQELGVKTHKNFEKKLPRHHFKLGVHR